MAKAPSPPPDFRFDPFADARMGLSLFQMTPDAWLVRDDEKCEVLVKCPELSDCAPRAGADDEASHAPA